MKTLLIVLTAAGLICLAAATGQAAPAEPGQGTFFSSVDTDGDGYLSKEEFLAAVPQAGEEGFRITDRDGDGKISHQEFAQMPGGRRQGLRPRGGVGMVGQTRFQALDADKDGALSYAETKTVLPGLGQDQFKAADRDGNGTLSHAEWVALKSKLGMATRRRAR